MSSHGRGETKSRRITEAAFHEVFTNEPSTVQRANVSKARKEKMKIAIALSKARAAGADIPKPRPQGSGAFVPEEILRGYRRIG